MKTITFIGNGNMALSIAKGLKNSYKIEVVGRSIENITKFEKELGVKIGKSLLDNFNIIQRCSEFKKEVTPNNHGPWKT